MLVVVFGYFVPDLFFLPVLILLFCAFGVSDWCLVFSLWDLWIVDGVVVQF